MEGCSEPSYLAAKSPLDAVAREEDRSSPEDKKITYIYNYRSRMNTFHVAYQRPGILFAEQ
jgi:hypothetical protein